MGQQISTEQLIYKIGVLTLENDVLRAQVEQLQAKIAEQEQEQKQNTKK